MDTFYKPKNILVSLDECRRISNNECWYHIISITQVNDNKFIVRYTSNVRKCSVLWQPGFGSFTTAFARLKIVKVMKQMDGALCPSNCTARVDNRCTKHFVHYTDTDSVKFTHTKDINLSQFMKIGKAFGEFDNELEGEIFSAFVVLGPKTYIEEKIKNGKIDKFKEIVHTTLDGYKPSINIIRTNELHRKGLFVYVRVDANNQYIPSIKSMRLTLNKRFTKTEDDGDQFKQTYPFGFEYGIEKEKLWLDFNPRYHASGYI